MCKRPDLSAGSMIRTVNKYSGRVSYWSVLRVTKSACKIVVRREDFRTGEMEFIYQPSKACYENSYTGLMFFSKQS